MTTINKGDRVKYARTFLRTIGVYTGALPSRIGTVAAIDDALMAGSRIMYVRWADEPGRAAGILECHLVRADRLHLEAV